MFEVELDFPKYHARIEVDIEGQIIMTDTKTNRTFDASTLFDRDIACDGISFGSSKPECLSGTVILITSKYGVVYRIMLHSFEYEIDDIEFIKVDTVGSTFCEYYQKPINERVGRELINLDTVLETANYHDYSVNGNLCIKHNARDHKEWKVRNFQEAVLTMMKQIVREEAYGRWMDVSHSGFEPPKRNLRGIGV